MDIIQKAEMVRYAEMADRIKSYISLHVPDEERADEIYQKAVDLIVRETDQ